MLFYSTSLLIICCSLAAVCGACTGSFINCFAWRLTHGESVLKGRSHCDICSKTLGFFDLIPIFSYIFSGGRCRYCKAKLSWSHLAVELLMAAAYVGVLLRFDLSLKTIEGMVLTTILAAVSLTDIYDRIIPDGFIIAGILARLCFILISKDRWQELLQSAIGGFAVAGAVLAVVLLFEKIKKVEAMGGGDIKLLFVSGLYLGWQGNILCVLVASVIGIIWGMAVLKSSGEDSRTAAIPWGPSIAVSAWLCYMFGEYLINAYLSLF